MQHLLGDYQRLLEINYYRLPKITNVRLTMEITREGENLGIGYTNYSIINTLASFPGMGLKMRWKYFQSIL